jgi:hypothetical protein
LSVVMSDLTFPFVSEDFLVCGQEIPSVPHVVC